MVLPREPDGREPAGSVAAAYVAELAARSDRLRARMRARNYARRSRIRHGDVTPDHERKMRAAAGRCPLCRVHLVDEPYLPDSKELDHVIPLNVGGTHTIGNVRIICRACNLARPKDGSDYAGPVTLWALEVSHAESPEVGSAAWLPRPRNHDVASVRARRQSAALATAGSHERR